MFSALLPDEWLCQATFAEVDAKPAAPSKSLLDEAWVEIVADLRRGGVGLRRLAVGGRGSGARVACRTAARTKPDCVFCTAFPLDPSRQGNKDRGEEIAAAAAVVPVTIIQGTADRFGGPPEVAASVAQHGQRVLTVGIPFLDHTFNLAEKATITDSEARLILVEAARRAVLRGAGNTGPLLAR